MALACLQRAAVAAVAAGPAAACGAARGYQCCVMSEFLKQVERDCNRICPVPRLPPQKVTILGAGSWVGQVTALLLKLQPVVRVLALWDDEPAAGVLGAALDLGHVDTCTDVQGYQGRTYLSQALHDADLVLICGGAHVLPCSNCATSDAELFHANMARVRSGCIAAAHFAPLAVLAVQTQPVDCNFGLCQALLEQAHAYEPRRLVGLDAASSMRAGQMASAMTGREVNVPVVGGTSRCTRVPVFSGKCPAIPQTQAECLTRLVREADDIICRVKCNDEQGHLSIGFATARQLVGIMSGMFVKPTIVQSMLVEQKSPERCYDLRVCSTPALVGAGGVQDTIPPKLSNEERQLLDQARCQLESALALGRSSGESLPRYCRSPPCYPCSCLPAPEQCAAN